MIDLGEKVGDGRRRWADFRRGIDEQVTKGRQEHVGAGVVQLLRLSREFDRGKIDNESDKQQIEGGWQAGRLAADIRSYDERRAADVRAVHLSLSLHQSSVATTPRAS